MRRAGADASAASVAGSALNLAAWRHELAADGDGTHPAVVLRNPGRFLERAGETDVVQRAANARERVAATWRGMKADAEAG